MKTDIDITRLYFDVPENTITSEDIERTVYLDYVNRFSYGISKLREAFSISNPLVLNTGDGIRSWHKETKDGGTQTEEGGEIPLTEVKLVENPKKKLDWQFRRARASWQAVGHGGKLTVINGTAEELMNIGYKKLKKDFVGDIVTKYATDAGSGINFQDAISKIMAASSKANEDYGEQNLVIFANQDDVYAYLGATNISTQDRMGMRYVEDFMGYGRLFMTQEIPAGTIYGTVTKNINYAYAGNASDVADVSGMVFDSTGTIGMARERVISHASVDIVVGWAVMFFVEDQSRVFKSAITKAAG